jgi:hypothetical protein
MAKRWRSSSSLVRLLAGRSTLSVLAELDDGGRPYQDLHDVLEGISCKSSPTRCDSPRRHPDISNRVVATAAGSRGPCVSRTVGPPVIVRGPGGLFTEDGGPSKSRSKRFGEPLPPLPHPERSDHATGLMIGDAVRYMSVHSWTQWDSHGLSGTSSGQKRQPARPGKSSSRAISAGGGRCWVRTNVG